LFIGYAEAFTPEQIASSLNTNVLGAHKLNRAVLPYMRKQASGLLLYVGSGITNVTAPFMTPYVIGKAALDALAENTAYEISQFGIETTILMPGVFMDGTSHFDTAEFPKDQFILNEYIKLQKDYDNYDAGLRKLFRFGDAPIQGVADKIAEIIALPRGKRPFRDTIDYSDWLAEPGNAVRETLTERAFKIMGYSHLLNIK
jgi:NAD(P)-dependent dehydrogenase (short-subunit alcohol dehydrogenase family)